MEKETEEKIKGLLTDQGLLVNGIGITNKKLDELIKILNKQTNTLIHMENKVEALMNPEAQKRHEEIKRRF